MVLCHGSGILQSPIHRIQPLPESGLPLKRTSTPSDTWLQILGFRYLGGVADSVLYDNMKTVVLSREGNNIHWNPQFMDFASHYGFMPKLCLPGRKETKGKIERPFSYIRSSFFRGTEFISLTDVNEKGRNWLDTVANTRIHGTTQEVPFQYSCRDLTVRLRDEELRIFYGDHLIATHRLSYQKGQMITDPEHFRGIPRPAYPSGVRAVREVFLVQFPRANPFLDGLVKAKYGNARYHMLQILNLLEDYPVDVVESAIEKAMVYGAFECGAIRNICRQGQMPETKLEEIELTQKTPLVSEPVEERSLSYYSQLEV